MKTEKYVNEQGEFRCFGFPNTLLGKQGTIDILNQLPDIEIHYLDKSWGAEVFCEFTYKGRKFDITEPYGDNSYYDISSETPNTKQLEEIYELFNSTKLPIKAQRDRYIRLLVVLSVIAIGVLVYKLLNQS